jgi:hypothetical protein
MALPKDVQIPKGASQFAKFQIGKNRFRFLSDVVVGWEMWQNKKPIRHEGAVCKFKPEDADTNKNGNPAINYFWAVVVWNYQAEKTADGYIGKIQTLEITQKTVMSPLYDYEQSPDWGDLKNYDVEINKKEEAGKTLYSVVGIPPKSASQEIMDAYDKTDIDLKKLFDGKYPMGDKGDIDIGEVDENGIPF